jgi:hypothetical protein
MFLNEIFLSTEPTRLFGIKLFDSDFWELLMRLALNLSCSYFIILKVYRATRKESDYLFTFMVFSPMVFFITHLFSSVDLSIGFAFGLFAVFSILRYRTTQVHVKEMTYMFIIIALAVLNAIANNKISYTELLFSNLFIVALTIWLERRTAKNTTKTKTVHYDKIELIAANKQTELNSDLSNRLGIKVERTEIIEADFVEGKAKLRVYFKD